MNEEKLQPTKFCKSCVHSYWAYQNSVEAYECHHESNLIGISPVNGRRLTKNSIQMMRTEDSLCGLLEPKFFAQRMHPVDYSPGITVPVCTGETMQERLERLRSSARQSSNKKSLNKIIIEDL